MEEEREGGAKVKLWRIRQGRREKESEREREREKEKEKEKRWSNRGRWGGAGGSSEASEQ